LQEQLERITTEFTSETAKIADKEQLEAVRVKFLGKKGLLTSVMKNMRDLSAEDKKTTGQKVNQLKEQINRQLIEIQDKLAANELCEQLEAEKIDIYLPGRGVKAGHYNPLLQTMEEIKQIFAELGYSVASGPEIEDDFHNFEALNIPEDHPARELQDTFYLEGGGVLRTHTSPVQVHVMQSQQPPIKIIAPGKVYRKDSDVSHSPVFHQIEGLYINEDVTFSQLKGTLELFLKRFFGPERKVLFRPSYFQFTEPSAEAFVECNCGGEGCRVCKGTGWLEILGCGMVDPNVFDKCGVDKEKYTGFAFGMGVERLTMLKYGINDIRLFYTSNLDFLDQF